MKVTTMTLGRRIEDLEERRQKLLETYTYRKTIADDVYRREDDRLAQEIVLAGSELHDAQLDELDIEGVLAFAEHVIMNAGRLWLEGTLDQRQRLQLALFPKGITYDQASGFGTAETGLFFTCNSAREFGASVPDGICTPLRASHPARRPVRGIETALARLAALPPPFLGRSA